MATKSAAAVGSAAWIAGEKENILQLLQQEKDELIFPVQHEMEWLNEHMAEIFDSGNVNLANVFKTPGKLRGKTPRTARKRNAGEARIPLSDVFASNIPCRASPMKSPQLPKRSEQQSTIPEQHQISEQPSKSQVDSGYHGSSQVEMEVDDVVTDKIPFPQLDTVSESQQTEELTVTGNHTNDSSFHSARENQTAKLTLPSMQEEQDVSTDNPVKTASPQRLLPSKAVQQAPIYPDLEELGSPSDESTPDHPVVRKSSLNFASLPPREPMKTSIGNRTSRTSHLEHSRMQSSARPSYFAKQAQDPVLAPENPEGADVMEVDDADDADDDEDAGDADDDEDADDDHIEILGHDESDMEVDAKKEHSKTSTQRLHDRIEMLGKAPPPRPSKSIPANLAHAAAVQSHHHALPEVSAQQGQQIPSSGLDDDDWIRPLGSSEHRVDHDRMDTDPAEHDSGDEQEFDVRAPELIAYEERLRSPPVRMSPSPGKARPGFGHAKSASTATLASPGKIAMPPPSSPAKSISVSNPAVPSTTPQGSPRRFLDISASKSRLQSIVKTAKGLFTTSASVSAAAKLETLSPKALHVASNTMPGMFPNMDAMLEDKPLPTTPPKEVRKTRSSTEKDKADKKRDAETKAMQKMNNQLEKAREEEREKAAQQTQKLHVPSSPRKASDESNRAAADMPPPQPLAKATRPTRLREATAKAKPQPVSIRVGALSQRMPLGTSSTTSTQETLPAEPKRPGLTKKASNASIQSSTSSTTFKTSVSASTAKPRALLAAERKKEQDEREAQRKLEQKRENERKRAAMQEEAKRREQKERAEAERIQEERVAAEQAKRLAQQQAIEKKRQEARKAEQQKTDRPAAPTAEQPAARPPSRLTGQANTRPLVSQALPTNPAKPAKRPLEESAEDARPQAPKFGAASQQADAKRRRTDEENLAQPPSRPTISGAPIRQSQLGKKPSIFNHSSYAPVPPPNHTNLNHFPPPPPRTHPAHPSQFGNGAKIPFADAPNPPATTKTPASAYQHKTIQAIKSSPQIPNGDHINLPEIPTDSEDEDSETEGNAFPIPDWATPGHLTDQLIRQESMDEDAVFGPIAPLKMEEIFAKGSKDRLKRLRDRTSSANWAISGDGLTVEEVRADREMRERMRIQGGWTYGNQ